MGQRKNWQNFRDLDLSSRKHRAAVCLDEEYIRSSGLDMFSLRYLLNRQDAVLGSWTRSGSSVVYTDSLVHGPKPGVWVEFPKK